MTLEGAINLKETADYIIYTMNSVTTGQYGVVVPKNIVGTLNMLIDLHMKNSFDGVGNGSKTREQLVDEISDEYNKLRVKYNDGMLVMPMIDEGLFQNTVINGDKQKKFDEVKKIGAITSELYKKLTDSGIEKQKINQKIIIVEKNQVDESFVVWLKEQMPNVVEGILYNEISPVEKVVNPFAGGESNGIFGPAPSIEPKVDGVQNNVETVTSGGIFDSVAPVAASLGEPIASASVASVVSPSEASAETVASSEVNNIPSSNVDIFGIPLDVQGVQNTEAAVLANNDNTMVQNNVVSSVGVPPVQPTVVEAPKPVESTNLEGTTTFSPLLNSVAAPANSLSEDSNIGEFDSAEHKSKGFANLLILLVVLVGVTIISIELGKFLYSVYGA